jgi:phage shock protein PspC (stress-responsive transcriptional regulator)
MFLLFYYIISVIVTFCLLSYILYKEEKYWDESVSIYDIDISIIGILVALSVFFGFLLFPYIIIRFIIEKIKGRI